MRYMKIIGLVALSISFLSCEKVIELELKDSDTKFVVEGIITNEANTSKVYLSRTNRFYQNNNFEMVRGATVKVKDNGVEFNLGETAPGTYENPLLRGIPGHRYELSVSVSNQFFSAASTMPVMVAMDTLYISRGPFGQFFFASVGYNDPATPGNHYRFVQYLNGKKDPEIFWENDEFTNGQRSLLQLDTGVDEKDDPRNINPGDEVMIEMHGLDKAVYRYWNSLESGGANGNGSTAAPANPVTNISGGALGYFSAHTVNRKTVIAP
jgi:hypothetical protein